MAKRQEAVNRPSKRGDSFFMKPKKKFNPKSRNEKFKRSNTEQSFKPSQSGGVDFFVKPSNNRLSEKVKKPQGEKKEKKPFDKKKYRLQKYSKKYKLEQWEDRRKTAILRGYYKELKDDEPKLDVNSIYEQYKEDFDSDDNADKTNEENENNLNASINQENGLKTEEIVPKSSKERKGKAFKRAYQEYQRIKEEKKKKREEMLKKKAEKEEALQAYKKKKAEKFKKLSRKTKKGQPIMKERMELLLEKIQSSMQ